MIRLICLRASLALTMIAAGLAVAAPGNSAPSAMALPSPQALDRLLTTTLRPARDLYTLTEQLKLHTTTPINPYVNQTPPHYAVGSTVSFYVSNDQETGFVQEPAALELTSAHAYFYVQQGFKVDPAALRRSAQTFEQHTYPTDRALYGQEWTPGVDDDPHITIFNGHLGRRVFLRRGPLPPCREPLQQPAQDDLHEPGRAHSGHERLRRSAGPRVPAHDPFPPASGRRGLDQRG
jgi:hypothetical protein